MKKNKTKDESEITPELKALAAQFCQDYFRKDSTNQDIFTAGFAAGLVVGLNSPGMLKNKKPS